MDLIADYISQYGYWAIALLLTLGLIGLPVPDEVLMLFVGYLCSIHVLNFTISILVAFIGSIAGMMFSYLIGNKLGVSIINKYGKWIGITPKRFEKIEHWFSRYGIWTILFAYFIPGVRHGVGYICGISKMPARKYLFVCSIGAATWTVLLISIGYFISWKFV